MSIIEKIIRVIQDIWQNIFGKTQPEEGRTVELQRTTDKKTYPDSLVRNRVKCRGSSFRNRIWGQSRDKQRKPKGSLSFFIKSSATLKHKHVECDLSTNQPGCAVVGPKMDSKLSELVGSVRNAIPSGSDSEEDISVPQDLLSSIKSASEAIPSDSEEDVGLSESFCFVSEADETSEKRMDESGWPKLRLEAYNLLSKLRGHTSWWSKWVVSGNDEKNQQKYVRAFEQLHEVDLSGEPDLKSLSDLLTLKVEDLGHRSRYQSIIDEVANLCMSESTNQNQKLQEFCSKLWGGLDMSRFYFDDIKRLLTEAEINIELNSFDDFVRLNNAFNEYLKQNPENGKSTIALSIQKLEGALRTMVWLSKNVPTQRELQTFMKNGDQLRVQIPYVRHSNAVRQEEYNVEVLDSSFASMLKLMKSEEKFVFYTSFLKNKEKIWENEYAGNCALRKAQNDHDNFYVLFQSVDCPLFKEGCGDAQVLFKELLREFVERKGESGEHFVLPSVINKQCNRDVKAQYMQDLELIVSDLHKTLFDNKEELSNEEWRAFCLVFFAMQRDHMKLFLPEMKLKEGRDDNPYKECGHYTTPCKDFLDRGGINAMVERMVHEAQLGTFHSKKGEWLEDEKFNLLGATWATKKIGVLEDRLSLGQLVYKLLEEKHEALKGYTYKVYGQDFETFNVKSYVREAINAS